MKRRFKYIRFFNEIGIDDVPLVGGKTASLGEMYRELNPCGVKVPDGFAITAEAYRYILDSANAWDDLHKALDDIQPDDMEDLAACGKQARDIVYGAPLPDDLRQEILEAYKALKSEYGQNLSVAVRSSATALPIDILKSEFPADVGYEKDESKLRTYCQGLSRASRLPWVLLSAGADFERFREEVRIACQNGASGFMAGRALWQEAARIHSREERLNFFRNKTVPRLKELTNVADTYGSPWYGKMASKNGGFALVPEGWYKSY